ncbi:putative plasmid pRiA4b ORF-3 family protein [Magnetofaba australis IT-1]|uniref:Putative plasmid pRiA4b ORF-3 family protein n=2 Tax=Magnetofaba TaxID=1472292 RepID=A0A1Y2K9V8_9PROT|nr:putative plasmid pRiA4b ORF-3 family protein [Magnetofaba australis IT-1]
MLRTIYGKGIRYCSYVYDFGDNWLHKIEIEGSEAIDPNSRYPHLVTGKRRCPPEDVGGILGYHGFLEAIKDINHPEHGAWMEWSDGQFDPEEFDRDAINSSLALWYDQFSERNS